MDAFEEHQVLELLLFFALPRKDTNPIAHRLLKKFGSIAGVFNAPLSELQSVEGVGNTPRCLSRCSTRCCLSTSKATIRKNLTFQAIRCA